VLFIIKTDKQINRQTDKQTDRQINMVLPAGRNAEECCKDSLFRLAGIYNHQPKKCKIFYDQNILSYEKR
jgi:hypothetical protein